MLAATTKAEFLAVMDKVFDKLTALIATVSEEEALAPDDEGVSIKDVIAHRAHWIRLFLGWYHDGLAGKEVHFPAKGYKWSELKRYNADLREKQKAVGWKGAVRKLRNSHRKLRELVEGLSNRELYGGPMKGARNDWTVGRWAEAAGPSHYRSAAMFLRARLLRRQRS